MGFIDGEPLFQFYIKLRLSRSQVEKLDILPARSFSYSFEKSFFDSKTGCQMLMLVFLFRAVYDFFGREDFLEEAGIFFGEFFHPFDIDDINPNPYDHLKLLS